jgi:hypothetical protein
MLCLAMAAALLAAGCAGQPASERQSDEVPIKHRIPSK